MRGGHSGVGGGDARLRSVVSNFCGGFGSEGAEIARMMLWGDAAGSLGSVAL